MSGVELIAVERHRQITEEGWTPEHDDQHVKCELADAAITYCINAQGYKEDYVYHWPEGWDLSWFKASDDPVRDLAKAGALIAAEIDRLQRGGGGH